jgi:hypothetical protein
MTILKLGTWEKKTPAKMPALRRIRVNAKGEGLDFGVGVGVDFAVEVDFFVLRGGPFHG